jgi:hypothetical protein
LGEDVRVSSLSPDPTAGCNTWPGTEPPSKWLHWKHPDTN